jgi:uncharacterized protein
MFERSKACAAILVGLAVLPTSAQAGAETIDDLYRAQTIVTGQGEENRLRGFPPCLEDVLIKVSGDPRLIGDPRLAPLEAKAPTFVASFEYHDRMAGLPTHDEQGTRDRPYDLIIHFDREQVDAALRSLGLMPWTPPRPRVAVFVEMQQAAARTVLTRDGDQVGPREALAAAADKRGIPILMPSTRELQSGGVRFGDLTGDAPGLDVQAKMLGADAALTGQLIWVDEDLGWAATWSLGRHAGTHHWQIRGVSFDEAFRNAMGGVAQILSGHGDPK